ncbi:hypothetical protein N9Y42_06315 [Mariniblastus sp.]|nr:hypothetical protein [Mariniblastus sp.]
MPGIVDAIANWLGGDELSDLYAKYPFVDERKRELMKIHDHVKSLAPELAYFSNFHQCGGDIYHLIYKNVDRSAKIYFYGKKEHPHAEFSWDRCSLFSCREIADNVLLGNLLKRWVVEQSQPSNIRKEFPTIEIGELADYYERGNPIEGEFLHSWISIEKFYEQSAFSFSKQILEFIAAMRQHGYDRTIRAGQSLSSLGLSRSRRHGLRRHQPSISFIFREGSMNVEPTFDSEGLQGISIQLTPDVKKILDLLVEQDIN